MSKKIKMNEPTGKTLNKSKTFMPSTVYKFRIIGMSLGCIPIAVVLVENNSPIYYWVWWIFTCLIWPTIAYLLAIKSKSPFESERFNLTFDSFIAGTWATLLHFNLLPAILLLVITTADKISSGIKNLWVHSLPFLLVGILIPGIFTHFEFQPISSTAVILACFPIIIFHTLFISISTYKLVRKVQKQNKKLYLLSQNDFLTDLFNRRYWQEQVEILINQCKVSDTTATIILIDIDDFKKINDSYGHSVGDEVLKWVATQIKQQTPDCAINGRFGGDEFAVVVPQNLKEAQQLAEKISAKIQQYKHPKFINIDCSISIGLAEINKENPNLRQWFDTADQFMYKAKRQGKNQIESHV